MGQSTLPGLNPDFEHDDEQVISSVEILEPMAERRAPPRIHPPPPPRWRDRARSLGGRPLKVEGKPRFARDLMTRQVLTIGPDDALESVEGYMQGFRFRHLPVVDGSRLVGLITRSDLLELSSSVLSKSAPEENAILHRLTASRIMKRAVVTVTPDEPLVNVAALMWETRVRCTPVTETGGNLVGILTEGDFVRFAHHCLSRDSS